MLDVIRQNAQSWGVKIAFGLIIIVFVFWGVGSMGNQSSHVLAMVGETPLTLSAYEEQYREAAERLRAQFPEISIEDMNNLGLKQQVLQQMVTEALLVEQAESLGLDVSPVELKIFLSRIPLFQGTDGKLDIEQYKKILAAQGLTPSMYEERVRRSLLVEKMQEYITMSASVTEAEVKAVFDYSVERRSMDYVLFEALQYMADSTPDEEQIKSFYDENLERYKMPPRAKVQYALVTAASLAKSYVVPEERVVDYYEANANAYVQKERIRAHHILVLADEDAAADVVTAAEKKINTLYDRVVGGEDFALVARSASEGPSAPLGGDLGWFGRGDMVPSFEEAAFATAQGAVSKPIRSRYGFHIIKVEAREEARIKALDEVREDIARKIAEEEVQGNVASILDEALEALLAGEDLSAVAERWKLELRDSEELARDRVADALGITPEAVELIFATPVGAIVDTPLNVEGGYMFAKVVSSKDEAYRALEDVRSDIIEGLRQKEALARALEEAHTVAEALEADGALPTVVGQKLQTSEPFGRGGEIPNVGQVADVVTAIFAAQDDKWIAKAFPTPSGAVVVRRAEVLPPTAEQWVEAKPRVEEALLARKRQELIQGYLQQLRADVKISIQNAKILE